MVSLCFIYKEKLCNFSLFRKGKNMDEIFKKIQDVEKFVNKRGQYAVLEAIHGKE